MEIGDHARKDLPYGFHSWSDRIKNGELCDATNYTIGTAPGLRPVGSTQAIKGTKNRFTPEEDERLAEYMLDRVALGDETATARTEVQPPQARHSNLAASRSPARALGIVPSSQVLSTSTDPEIAARFRKLDMRYKIIQARNRNQPVVANEPVAANELAAANEPVTESDSEPDIEQQEIRPAAPEFAAPSQPLTLREEFYSLYKEYCEAAGVEQVPWVSVGGRALPLWDLWCAAIEHEQPPEHRDWEEIADSLGFDWIDDTEIPGKLKAAFDIHLGGDFEIMMKEFEAEGDGDVADQDEDTSNQSVGHDEDEDGAAAPGAGIGYDSEQFVSSPPVTGQKRRFTEALLSSAPGLSSPYKRRRYEEHEEIPYTPDKPSQKSTMALQNRLASATVLPKVEEVDSSPQQLPRALRVAVEPETQDFQFVDIKEAPWDTPSQQLRSEETELAARRSTQQAGGAAALPAYSSPPPSSSRSEFPPVDNIRARPKKPAPQVTDDSDSEEAFDPPVPSASRGGRTRFERPVQPVRRSLPSSWQNLTQPPPTTQQPSRRSLISTANPLSHLSSHASPSVTPGHRAPGARSGSSLVRERSIVDRLEALGYPKDTIITAVAATMGDPGLTGHVTQSLLEGRGIPKDERGVWTEIDDKNLRTIGGVDFAAKSTATGIQEDKIRWAKAAKREAGRTSMAWRLILRG